MGCWTMTSQGPQHSLNQAEHLLVPETQPNPGTPSGATYVSTGHLPEPNRVQRLITEAHELFRDNSDGENAQIYPALADVPSDLFGLCVVDTDGTIYVAGDAEVEFSMMSVAKPFVFALICQEFGAQASRETLGVNATGLPFNSLAAVENGPGGRTNPMVNSGAIATTSLAPGTTVEDQWAFVLEGMSRFAGRALAMQQDVYTSSSATNHRNQSIARLLLDRGRLTIDPASAVELYTRQSSLGVSARDLAVMGATLADGGVNPLTGERVVSADTCRYALAVMATSGLYETSGDWLYNIGLPAKSGIGGGIVTSVPGKGGLGTFAPRLDAAGNSVKGQLAAHFLSNQLGLNLFASLPSRSGPVLGATT